jgi:hypothetical protein
MKTIDMRFDEEIFRQMINQKFKKYRCDPFVYTPSVTRIVGLYIGSNVYKMTNIEEKADYFGNDDEVAISRFEKTTNEAITSAFCDESQIDTPIEEIINKIIIVNENQKTWRDGKLDYDVFLTRGIIFCVDNREISFEKQNWPYSEEIIIRRGYQLIDSFGDITEFSKGWDQNIKAEASRMNVVLE